MDIRPFTLAIPENQLDDLRRRLAHARYPEVEPVDDWSQGTKFAYLSELVNYWQHAYVWRRCESELNSLDQFTAAIDGCDIHFLHVRSSHEDAMPLLLTHGWPGSVVEFLDAIPRLTEPEKFGGVARDAFHVVVPTLPGFGFSGKPRETGWGIARIASAWGRLMQALGYERWVAQGGDWGAAITAEIGRQAPKGCAGIHLSMIPTHPTEEDRASDDESLQRMIAGRQHYADAEADYARLQATKPQTIGYALVDSPVGLAAWILEKIRTWTDNEGSPYDALSKDRILDNIMLYWLPATGASAARLYWESAAEFYSGDPVKVPGGATLFPKDIIPAPRAWAERLIPELVYWNEAGQGGHFAAWEEPELFVDELRACFRAMR